MFNIVLVEPEIPQNTGNIVRTAAATGCTVHLVKPLGFDISDRALKRAGLDYWRLADFRVYEDLSDLFERNAAGRYAHAGGSAFQVTSEESKPSFWFLSTKAAKSYAEAAFVDGASHFTVFRKIMLPMTRGTFGALFITAFITQWTDYMTPMIYLPTHPTIAQAAWGLQFSNTSVPYLLAGLFILALPVLILFCCFHKKLMGSMTMGGLKG